MKTVHDSCTRIVISAVLGLCAMVLLTPSPLHGQLLTFCKQDLADYTAQSNFERFPDGRPKVPEDLMERARELSSEEVWAVLEEKGFHNQYADGFQILHPETPMVGRAFTVQFIPDRPDGDWIASSNSKAAGIRLLSLWPTKSYAHLGDVLIVD